MPALRIPISKCLMKLKELKDEILNKIIKEKLKVNFNQGITYYQEENIGNRIKINHEEMQEKIEMQINKVKKPKFNPSNNYKINSISGSYTPITIKKRNTSNSNVKRMESLYFKPFLTMLDLSINNFQKNGVLKNILMRNGGNQGGGANTIREASEIETTSRREKDSDKKNPKEFNADTSYDNDLNDLNELHNIKTHKDLNDFNLDEPSKEFDNENYNDYPLTLEQTKEPTVTLNIVNGFRKKFLHAENKSVKISIKKNESLLRKVDSIGSTTTNDILFRKLESINNTNESSKNNILSTDNIHSTRHTWSIMITNENDVNPSIKRTIDLFSPRKSIISYRSGRFNLPLITSFGSIDFSKKWFDRV